MCNCYIGYLHGYEREDLSLDDYIDVLLSCTALSPRTYLDRRRGLATLFNFCPWCGKKIDWKEIKSRL